MLHVLLACIKSLITKAEGHPRELADGSLRGALFACHDFRVVVGLWLNQYEGELAEYQGIAFMKKHAKNGTFYTIRME